jgi:hypothetical protein
MNIYLNDSELTEALIGYVKTRYGLDDNNDFAIQLKAGRNWKTRVSKGNSAVITVAERRDPNAPVQLELPLEEPVSSPEEVSATQVLVEPVEAPVDDSAPFEEDVIEEDEPWEEPKEAIEPPKFFSNPSLRDIEQIKEPEDKPSFKSLFA